MPNDNETDNQVEIQWDLTIDNMLANGCDQAKCFNWMHTEAYSRYNKLSTRMNITLNILISLSGVANIVLGSVLKDSTLSSMGIGSGSIIIGMVKMIQEQFNWTGMANDFKQSAKQWEIITRKIQSQLILPYSGRKDCGTFLKFIKQDIDNASETNTLIPKYIREKCNQEFGKIKDFDVPDICGQVEHTTFYVPDTLSIPLSIGLSNNELKSTTQ